VVLARVLEDLDKPENLAAAEESLTHAAAALAHNRQRQMRRAFGQAARKQTPDALHAARIAIKKLRYILELLQESKRGLKRQIRELKRLQELLGDHHDVHVIVAALAEYMKKNPAPNALKRRQLATAWRRWHRLMQRTQAQRAANFFTRSYTWMNR
jgi:CHAD domain-containing protein